MLKLSGSRGGFYNTCVRTSSRSCPARVVRGYRCSCFQACVAEVACCEHSRHQRTRCQRRLQCATRTASAGQVRPSPENASATSQSVSRQLKQECTHFAATHWRVSRQWLFRRNTWPAYIFHLQCHRCIACLMSTQTGLECQSCALVYNVSMLRVSTLQSLRARAVQTSSLCTVPGWRAPV